MTTILTTAEAAKWLKMSPDSVKRLVRRGSLQAIRVTSRMWRFRMETLEKWVKDHET